MKARKEEKEKETLYGNRDMSLREQEMLVRKCTGALRRVRRAHWAQARGMTHPL